MTDNLTPEGVAETLKALGGPATFDRDVLPALVETGTGWSLASMGKWWLLATISESPGGEIEIWWLNARGIGSDSWAGDTAYWEGFKDAQAVAQLLNAEGHPVPVRVVNLGDWCRYGDRQVAMGGRRSAKPQFRTEATRAFAAAYEAARAGA